MYLSTPASMAVFAIPVWFLALVGPASAAWELFCVDALPLPNSMDLPPHSPAQLSFQSRYYFDTPSEMCSAENVGCFCSRDGLVFCSNAPVGPGRWYYAIQEGGFLLHNYCFSICMCFDEPLAGIDFNFEDDAIMVSDGAGIADEVDIGLTSSSSESSLLICNGPSDCPAGYGINACKAGQVKKNDFATKYLFGLCVSDELRKRQVLETDPADTSTGGVLNTTALDDICVCNCTHVSRACCGSSTGIVSDDTEAFQLVWDTAICGPDGADLDIPVNTTSEILDHAHVPNITSVSNGQNVTGPAPDDSYGLAYDGPPVALDLVKIFGPNATEVTDASDPSPAGTSPEPVVAAAAPAPVSPAPEPVSPVPALPVSAQPAPPACKAAGNGCWLWSSCGDSNNCYCGNLFPKDPVVGLLSTHCIDKGNPVAAPEDGGAGGGRKRSPSAAAAADATDDADADIVARAATPMPSIEPIPGFPAGSVCPCNCSYISSGCCGAPLGIVHEDAATFRVGAVEPPSGSCCNLTTGAIQNGTDDGGGLNACAVE